MMEDRPRRRCLQWPLLGLCGLGLLGLLTNYLGKNNATNLQELAVQTAQQGLDVGRFGFATASIEGANLVVAGSAPDQSSKKAACNAANDALLARKMVGLPGLVKSVICDVTAPGEAVASSEVNKSPDKPIIAPEATAAANSAVKTPEAIECQSELNTAAKSGTVNFEKGGSDIASGQQVLDKVSEVAKKCTKYHIEVGGHTDSSGNADMNMQLSQSRAEVVEKYLVSKGVSASQLSAKGYGSSQPLVDDHAVFGVDSPERMKNRRTEFKITAQQ